jgi:hypothetical protein
MVLKIEIDLGDMVESIGSSEELAEVIKQEIVRRAVDVVMKRVNLGDVQRQAENEYKNKLNDRVKSMAESSQWLVDNMNSHAYVKNVVDGVMPEAVKRVAAALKNDADFVRSVAKETLK